MTVKELKDILEQYDENMTVCVWNELRGSSNEKDNFDWYVWTISSIRVNRSYWYNEDYLLLQD